VTKHQDLIPLVVLTALVKSALLFIGFQMHDWPFRVLFRSIMALEGHEKSKDVSHVAVQIDPEEGRLIEPEGARKYLQSYFQNANISIYWDSAEDFGRELQRRTQACLG
jgi:hypothetical protein